MQKKETAIEVKVGALVLFSTLLLVAFVFLLGDMRFGDSHDIHVQFETAGGLKQGAEVAISGIVVGSVNRLEFIRNEDPESGLPAVAVQVTLRVNPSYADSIRQNSRFYITTRGVLGEPYVEITTPSFDAPVVASGDGLRGVDPPRMEILLGQAEELLETVVDILREDQDDVRDLVVNASSFFKTVGGAVGDNRDAVDSTLQNLEITTNEAASFLAALNAAIGEDGQRLDGIVSDAETTVRNARGISSRLSGQINQLDPILGDVAEVASDAREITDSTRRLLVDNEGRIVASIENVETATENFQLLSDDAVTLMTNVSDGEGTIGALLVEREMYEDLKDILRSIKQQPWRILWKE